VCTKSLREDKGVVRAVLTGLKKLVAL